MISLELAYESPFDTISVTMFSRILTNEERRLIGKISTVRLEMSRPR